MELDEQPAFFLESSNPPRRSRGQKGKDMEEIKNAIQALGFRSGTVVSVRAMRSGRALVSINGQSFGVWDAHKKTFVD